jgi:polar amino acid transport system substrate-binding protein
MSGMGSQIGGKYRTGIARRALAPIAALVLLLACTSFASAATLDRVRETGKLTLGYRADARPFSYTDEAGKAAGYSIALCQRIADAVKAELKLPALSVEWVPVTLEGRFKALQEGKIDLLCGADTETLSRRKDVAFSIATFAGGIGAVMRAKESLALRAVLNGTRSSRPIWRGDPARTLLAKATFSVLPSTTSEAALTRRMRELDIDATVVPVDSYQAGIDRVLERKTDVFFGDRQILVDAVARSSSKDDLVVLDRRFTYEAEAFALPRGDEDFRLLVDRTLSTFYNTKQFLDEYTKWFGKPSLATAVFFVAASLPE